jgi:hypothetical protein
MKLPWYVISKGSLIHHLPLIGKSTAQSIGAFILIPDPIYRDLQTDSPNPKHIALLIHEETHKKRQSELGFIKFGVQYIFNSKFRFNEELLAVKAGMKYLKENNIPFDFDKNAKFLSSYVYLWPVSKEYAQKELQKVWNEI